MRRELAAGTLLLCLIAASLLNLRHLHGLTDELCSLVEASQSACEAGSFKKAEVLLRSAMDSWESAEGYTHIFVRHSEIDSATDAFCELLGDVSARDPAAAAGSYEKLLSHLRGLYTMERLTPGSVF